jgi:trehalose-phosphatase
LSGESPALAAVPPDSRETLDRAAALIRIEGLGAHLEEKRASLSFHTRGLPADDAEALTGRVESVWRPLAAAASLRLARFDGGIELGADGYDKGHAVLHLLELEPPGTLAVHVGDDESDEEAFEAIGERGFGIRVGEPDRPTRAAGWLRSQGSVELFLEAWLQAATRTA